MPEVDILLGYNEAELIGEYATWFFNDQTVKDFQVIFLGKEEPNLSEATFEWKWFEEKGQKWHPEIRTMLHSRYKNELFLHAESKYFISFDGWQVVTPTFIEEHLKYLRRGYAVCGTRIEMTNNAQFYQPGDKLNLYNLDPRDVGMPYNCTGGLWYSCSASAKLEDALKVNGFDMRFCSGGGGEDQDMGLRLQKLGVKMMYNPNCVMYHLSHDVWKSEYHNKARVRMGLPVRHNPHPFRASPWDVATNGDDDLLENDELKCFYDKWGIKRWVCKKCGASGIVESMHILNHNIQNNIIATPCGIGELKKCIN